MLCFLLVVVVVLCSCSCCCRSACATATEMAHAASHGISLSSCSPTSTTTTDGDTPPPAPEATKEDAPPLPKVEIPLEYVEQLTAMGFSQSDSERALKKFHLNVEESLNWLLTDPNELRTPEEESSLAKHQSMSVVDKEQQRKKEEDNHQAMAANILAKLQESQQALQLLRASSKQSQQNQQSQTKPQNTTTPQSTTKAGHRPPRKNQDCNYGFGAGEANAAKADNEIMLVRRLMAHSYSWSRTITAALRQVLLSITSSKDTLKEPLSSFPSSSSSSSFPTWVASFAVLGGHVESVRIGGRVKVLSPTSTNTGVVLNRDYGNGECACILHVCMYCCD
jgi:hypothetical protein